MLSEQDWASGESVYGELKEGMVLDFPISFCKELLKDTKGMLEELKKYASYEIAIGLNGKYTSFFFASNFSILFLLIMW